MGSVGDVSVWIEWLRDQEDIHIRQGKWGMRQQEDLEELEFFYSGIAREVINNRMQRHLVASFQRLK